MEEQIHACLTSALVRTEWSVSHSGRFTLRERALDAHWIRRLNGSQSRSECGREEKESKASGSYFFGDKEAGA
jgi:hypothetical protein